MMQPLSHAEVLGRWTGAFVDELVACGVGDVCLCPGSRSTPLALTFARHPAIRVWTHLDERSCAYFALGMAKARRAPVAILCSSGTAAVNFAPAVVEAYHSRVPLIVLTADRPPELQELGANQTIKQSELYGPAVKWFTQLPLPEASDQMLRYVRMVADRAVATTLAAPRGPVHLNFPFREPLMPAAYPFAQTNASIPQTRAPASGHAVDASVLDGLRARRGLIVAGPQSVEDEHGAESVARLAEALSWPVLADPLSGLRATGALANVLAAYDAYLRLPSLVQKLAPDVVLRLGDPPTSKPLATCLQRWSDARQIVVAAPGTWPDPDLTAAQIVSAGVAGFCETALARLSGAANGHLPEGAAAANAWLAEWQQTEARARIAIEAGLAEQDDISEPSAVLDLATVVPGGWTVVAGNSMPVRDLDSFFGVSDGRKVGLIGNRGASGIDGVVSTAMGASAALGGRVVLVIGDLSFYHDMNGLLAAQRHGLSATIVLINNDGGGIFSFLAQHDDETHFEELFGTPHGLDFSHVAGLYGVGFERADTREAYRDALARSFGQDGVQVIEVRTGREQNLELHQRIWAEVATAVESGEQARAKA